MNKLELIEKAIIFLIGFLSCVLIIIGFAYFEIESPLGFGFNNSNISAPNNWVEEKAIHIYDDKIVIDVAGASLSRYAPTGSMKPVIDSESTGIRIKPTSEEEISIGDIVSFNSPAGLIVHRVIEKGEDEEGIYFITKGDNNSIADNKIRFEDIKYVTIGVVW